MMFGPNPDAVHPNENIPSVCYIKNVITRPNIEAGNIPPYTVAAGNPCRVIRPRFDRDLTEYLLELRWWDWDAEKIFRNLEALCSGDLERIRSIGPRGEETP